MWPVTAAWLSALGASHSRYTRIEAWYAGEQVGEYMPESGAVQVTGRNRVRRTLSAVLPESAWPVTALDPLAPTGQRLLAYQGIRGVDGTLIGSEVPVFAGRVEKVSRQRLSGRVQIEATDPAADINDQQFEQPYSPPSGALVTATISTLIRDVYRGANVVDSTGSQATVPAGIMWDTDRGKAIDDLAAAIGAEVYCLPDGATWVIRPVPVLSGTPVWTLADGRGGTMVRDQQSKARTGVANRVIVHVEQSAQTPVTVTVTDDDANSPTYFGGPYGKVIEHYSNSLIGTQQQAALAGYARLSRLMGLTRTRDIDHIPNPALEGGDLIAVQTSDGTELHIADVLRIPLEVTTVATSSTRSTQASNV